MESTISAGCSLTTILQLNSGNQIFCKAIRLEEIVDPVVCFAFDPFNYVGVFAETALVTNLWQTGVTLLTRTRSIARLVIGTTGRWSDGCEHVIFNVMGSKSDTGALRGLAIVEMPIVLFINFFGGLAL